jgi:hypothetical protein
MTGQVFRCPLTPKRGSPVKAQTAATISRIRAFYRAKSRFPPTQAGGNNTLYRFGETPLGSCGVRPSAGELLAVLRNG